MQKFQHIYQYIQVYVSPLISTCQVKRLKCKNQTPDSDLNKDSGYGLAEMFKFTRVSFDDIN